MSPLAPYAVSLLATRLVTSDDWGCHRLRHQMSRVRSRASSEGGCNELVPVKLATLTMRGTEFWGSPRARAAASANDESRTTPTHDTARRRDAAEARLSRCETNVGPTDRHLNFRCKQGEAGCLTLRRCA